MAHSSSTKVATRVFEILNITKVIIETLALCLFEVTVLRSFKNVSKVFYFLEYGHLNHWNSQVWTRWTILRSVQKHVVFSFPIFIRPLTNFTWKCQQSALKQSSLWAAYRLIPQAGGVGLRLLPPRSSLCQTPHTCSSTQKWGCFLQPNASLVPVIISGTDPFIAGPNPSNCTPRLLVKGSQGWSSLDRIPTPHLTAPELFTPGCKTSLTCRQKEGTNTWVTFNKTIFLNTQ